MAAATLDVLVSERGLEQVGYSLGDGVGSGLGRAANLMVYTGAAALCGYLIGDLMPDVINYAISGIGNALGDSGAGIRAIQIPHGFGVQEALAVPEQVLLGHDYARNIPMAYLVAAPMAAKYLGEQVFGPLVRPVVDAVRGR